MAVLAVEAHIAQLPYTQLSLSYPRHALKTLPRAQSKVHCQDYWMGIERRKRHEVFKYICHLLETDKRLGYWPNQASPDRTAIIGRDSATICLKYLRS